MPTIKDILSRNPEAIRRPHWDATARIELIYRSDGTFVDMASLHNGKGNGIPLSISKYVQLDGNDDWEVFLDA